MRPPVAANGWPAASEEPLTLSLARSIEPSGSSRPRHCLQNAGVLPGGQRGQHGDGEGLVDLVEVEVLQRQLVAGQQARHGVHRCHQQAVGLAVAVHVVDGARSRRRPGAPAPAACARRPTRRWPAARPTRRRSAAWSCRPSSWRRRRACRTPGESLASFSSERVGPQVLVAGQAEERRDQVVEEPAVVGRGQVAGGSPRPARPAPRG